MEEQDYSPFEGFMYDRDVVEEYGRLAIADTLNDLPKLLNSDEEAKMALHDVYAQRLLNSIDRIETLTESPIEKQVAYSTFLTLFIRHPSLCAVSTKEERPTGVKYWLMPNYWITKKIRADLFISPNQDSPKSKKKGLVVECDSFQYHGDKDAFAKDKIREREIIKTGYPVIRFSGREINQNPYKVSCEVVGFMNNLFHISKHLVKT